MAIIRPIKEEDIKNAEGEVSQTIGGNPMVNEYSVEGHRLFGCQDLKEKEGFENTEIYNKKGYIALGIPVLNFFLAGDDARFLKKILGTDIAAIANGKIIYNTKENIEIELSDIPISTVYNNYFLIGGDYITYLIQQLDVEEKLHDFAFYLMKQVYKKCKMKHDILDGGSWSTIGGVIEVIDGIWYTPTVKLEELEHIKRELRIVKVKELSSYSSLLTLLLSIRKNKEAISNQVMEYLMVLPIGFRPSYQDKRDKVTKIYDNIVKLNKQLRRLLIHQETMEVIIACYGDLVNAIKHLTIKHKNTYDLQYKALLDLLKGKKGLIRDKMQGVRIDYSGRAVIIVDPEMSIDTIGIPMNIAEKVMELTILKNYKTQSKSNIQVLSRKNKELREQIVREHIEEIYGVIGRQPTLYQLGVRGFKLKLVEGHAIVLNPLSTTAFNADFDGDQMHFNIPVTKEAQEEIAVLMAMTNNIYLPRSGESHIAPRQEIIFGLWRAFTADQLDRKAGVYEIKSEAIFMDDICMQRVNCYDYVTLNGKREVAGRAAIRCCLPHKYRNYRLGVVPLTTNKTVEEIPVNEKFFQEMIKEIGLENKQWFVETTNQLVRLGFHIANIFPPNIQVVNVPDMTHFMDEFDKSIKEREEYYNLGLETEKSFTLFYNQSYRKLETSIMETLLETFGEDNGFIQMIKSGARGNKSNLLQIFGMKGQVMKKDTEAFNAILKNSLVEQLSGLEHFISAYGGRQGLIDKTIATYAPGYLSRKMSHTTSGFSIVSSDCGTKKGIVLDYTFLIQFLKETKLEENEMVTNKKVKEFTIKIIVGRYIVGRTAEIKTKKDAEKIYDLLIASVTAKGNLEIKKGITLRSPITCEKPCCAKCYGRDLGTNTKAVKGLLIGHIASQSIGEPGTQLTMKNFQSGGVAGVTNLTSSFDKMETYIHLYEMREPSKPLTYDFISPVEGYTETISRGDGTKILYIKNINEKGQKIDKLTFKVILYEEIEIKEYVHRGESIQKIQGDFNIRELIEYKSIEEAQRYLVLILFQIFLQEVFVSMKHFEVLVAGMTCQLCLSGNSYFKTGLFYTLQEYYAQDQTGCEFETILKGVGDVPLYRNDVFSTIFMEDIRKGIGRSIITSGKDEMKLPIVRYTFGLPINMGSAVEGYLENRGDKNV